MAKPLGFPSPFGPGFTRLFYQVVISAEAVIQGIVAQASRLQSFGYTGAPPAHNPDGLNVNSRV